MAAIAALAAGTVVAGAVSANQAKQAAKGARNEKSRAEAELQSVIDLSLIHI